MRRYFLLSSWYVTSGKNSRSELTIGSCVIGQSSFNPGSLNSTVIHKAFSSSSHVLHVNKTLSASGVDSIV